MHVSNIFTHIIVRSALNALVATIIQSPTRFHMRFMFARFIWLHSHRRSGMAVSACTDISTQLSLCAVRAVVNISVLELVDRRRGGYVCVCVCVN